MSPDDNDLAERQRLPRHGTLAAITRGRRNLQERHHEQNSNSCAAGRRCRRGASLGAAGPNGPQRRARSTHSANGRSDRRRRARRHHLRPRRCARRFPRYARRIRESAARPSPAGRNVSSLDRRSSARPSAASHGLRDCRAAAIAAPECASDLRRPGVVPGSGKGQSETGRSPRRRARGDQAPGQSWRSRIPREGEALTQFREKH